MDATNNKLVAIGEVGCSGNKSIETQTQIAILLLTIPIIAPTPPPSTMKGGRRIY
jgi:hypothetical protein